MFPVGVGDIVVQVSQKHYAEKKKAAEYSSTQQLVPLARISW